MPAPVRLDALEARCWTLAGERMNEEPALALLRFADLHARPVLELVVRDWNEPVAAIFDDAERLEVVEDLDPDLFETLATTLLTWAGARTSELVLAVDGLSEAPPASLAALREWVLEHGIREHLDDSLRRASSLALENALRYRMLSMGHTSVGHVLEGRAQVMSGIRDAARSYLAWAAGRRALDRRREELWSRAPAHPEMRRATDLVRALLDGLVASDVSAVPFPASGVTMGPTAGMIGYGAIVAPLTAIAGRSEVWVSLVERRGSRALASHTQGYAHELQALRLCAEHALDALHDEAHPHHEDLREQLTRPRWMMMLADLEQRVNDAPAPRTAFDEDERLVWRVSASPPEVEAAVQKRGKKSWSKGRVVSLQWIEDRPGALDPRDRRVLEAARGRVRAWQPARHVEEVGAALEALIGHPRVTLRDKPTEPVRVQGGAVELKVIERHGASWLRFQVGDALLDPHELLEQVADPHHVVSFDEGARALTVAPVPPALLELALGAARWETGLPPEADDALLALVGRMPASVGVALPPRLRGEPLAPDVRPVLRLEPLAGGALRAELWTRPLPGGPAHPPGEGPTQLAGVHQGRRVHVTRELADERRAAERAIAGLGLDAGVSDGPHAFRLDDPEAALDMIARLREHPELAVAEWPRDAHAWSVVGSASWSNTRVSAKRAQEWFGLRGEVTIDEEKVALAQLMRALRDGRRYVTLGKGRFVKIEEQLRASLEQVSDVVFEDGGELGVAGDALAQVEALLPEAAFTPDVAWKKLKKRLAASPAVKATPPRGLEAELREYQREGIAWLLRVSSWASGACLADDMGLGKTLQALALVLARAKEGPALVVCPTSVADNWLRETRRFTPGLEPVLYRGADRGDRLKDLAPKTLLIASYDVMLRDVEALRAIPFSTVVFDEAHAMKNAEARRTVAARQLQAGFRLGLTGTPLENHLGELWSLFSVLVPGLLGPWKHFKARFAAPIERDTDLGRKEALRSLLRPFLLRRRKDQVAPELPPRTDVVRIVELSEEEAALYEAERRRAVQELEEARTDPKKRFQVLAALTRMRRLACHPRLVDPASTVKSSKLEAALELCEDLAREGHRALVFSQFTTHLALAAEALRARGFELLYLDGQTPAAKRGELVRSFQEGTVPFFLISLKAGGTGLNLTAADTVIHLDPWWNPAAEDQASDRAHRIGQHLPVTVVRLVSQGTIEETVVELHEHKRDLARGLLEGAETNATLDTAELLALLGG